MEWWYANSKGFTSLRTPRQDDDLNIWDVDGQGSSSEGRRIEEDQCPKSCTFIRPCIFWRPLTGETKTSKIRAQIFPSIVDSTLFAPQMLNIPHQQTLGDAISNSKWERKDITQWKSVQHDIIILSFSFSKDNWKILPKMREGSTGIIPAVPNLCKNGKN